VAAILTYTVPKTLTLVAAVGYLNFNTPIMEPAKVTCITCEQSVSTTAYVKYDLCEHFICWICYFKLDEAVRSVVLKCICLPCTLADIESREPKYEDECPTCYIWYNEGNSRATHDCLDDEGVYDLQDK
jgi:hypothetical protein